MRRLPALALLAPLPAFAHHVMGGALPSTFMQGLLSGLGHPLIGVDHAAFIVAAGFVLALVPRGFLGILALIGGSLAGAALHLAGISFPVIDAAVALTVMAIAFLLALRRPIALPWLADGLMLAGALHGYAYAETIVSAERSAVVAYLIGFSLIQLGVASAAFWLHRRLIARPSRFIAPALASVVGAIGILFLIGNLV